MTTFLIVYMTVETFEKLWKKFKSLQNLQCKQGGEKKSLQCLQEGPLKRKLAEPSWHHFWPVLTVRLLSDTEQLTWLVYSDTDLFYLTVPPAVPLSGRQQGHTRICPFQDFAWRWCQSWPCVTVVDRGRFIVSAFPPPLHTCQDLSSQQYFTSGL